MYLKIDNQSDQIVKAKVFKSGKVQKREAIAAGKSHKFKFEWCDLVEVFIN